MIFNLKYPLTEWRKNLEHWETQQTTPHLRVEAQHRHVDHSSNELNLKEDHREILKSWQVLVTHI